MIEYNLTFKSAPVSGEHNLNGQEPLFVDSGRRNFRLRNGSPAAESTFTIGEVPDMDGDGIGDASDNCQLHANPGQRDTDGDGYGNRRDPDFNNDGTVNFLDLAYIKSVFFGSDPHADLNGDGAVNFQDLAITKAFFFMAPGPSGIAH